MQFLCTLHTYLPYIDQLTTRNPKNSFDSLQRMHVRLHPFSTIHTYSLSHHMHIFQLEAKLKMHTKKYKQQQKQQQQQRRQHNRTTLNNGYFSFTTYFPHIFFLFQFFSRFFHLAAVPNVYGCIFLFVLCSLHLFLPSIVCVFFSSAKAVRFFSRFRLIQRCVYVCYFLFVTDAVVVDIIIVFFSLDLVWVVACASHYHYITYSAHT